MARTDTLPNFLTDVADAIREKKGTEETIQASDFDTEIANLPSGGADISEYFDTSVAGGNTSDFGFLKAIKKLPALPNTGTSCQCMFMRFKGEQLDVSNFDTSNVSDFQRFFGECSNLKEIVGINNLNTQNVTSMDYCFIGCSSLQTLDISNWVAGSNTRVSYMFWGCTSLQHLDIRNINFVVTGGNSNVFDNVPANCEIIVKNDTVKSYILKYFRSDFTNIKTAEEYEAE